jgi:hypothetical protein
VVTATCGRLAARSVAGQLQRFSLVDEMPGEAALPLESADVGEFVSALRQSEEAAVAAARNGSAIATNVGPST